MNLNLDTIASRLPQKYQTARYGAKSGDMDLKCVLMYEPGREMKPGFLYAAYAKDLPPKPPAHGLAVVCVGTEKLEAWSLRQCQVLVILNETSLTSVLNDIAMLFEAFQEWDSKLKIILQQENGADLKTFLELGSEMLGNRLCVLNEGTEEVMSVNEEPGTIHAAILEVPKKRLFVGGAINVANYEIHLEDPYLSIAPSKNACYCFNLRQFGKYCGTIVLSASWRPFLDGDFPLADYYFPLFSKAYEKYLQFSTPALSLNRSAFSKLLQKEELTEEERRVFVPEEGKAWAIFAVEKPKNEGHFPLSHMAIAISSVLEESIAVVFGDIVLGIMRVSARSGEWKISPAQKENYQASDNPGKGSGSSPERNFLDTVLKYYQSAMGISNPFSEIQKFESYRYQAVYALKNVGVQGKPSRVSLFRELSMQYLLSHCTGEVTPESLYPYGLTRIFLHDEISDISYSDTLEAYLSSNLNLSSAAKVLHLHRSSLISRMERIQSILEINLEDPDAQLFLRICLKLKKTSILPP